jgi:hypothetical protein
VSESDDPKTSGKAGDAAGSGSIDVSLSAPNAPVLPPDAAPEGVPRDDSAPVTSGRVQAAVAPDEVSGPASPGRSRRITASVQGAVSGGVERLGSGIGSIGEGVSKLGDMSKKVPLVGAGVSRLGEGLVKAGESIHELPRVAQTRRGRLLVRSVIVGFLLVFAWISAIVMLQLRRGDTPDFRPAAEQILVKLSSGSAAIDDVYEHASPRFQEMVRKERFVDDMTDLAVTAGKFQELTAINDTLVTNGPGGQVGRLSLTASYQKGLCKGSISFHWDQGQWKLLGIGIELPPELAITPGSREQRVKLCDDPMDLKKCVIHHLADTILHQVQDGHAGEVWDAATQVFQTQETRAKFIQIQAERHTILGDYKRVIDVTEAKQITGTSKGLDSATFDVLAEFERSSGVRVVFGFTRTSKADRWQLRSLKLVLPMPRADEAPERSPPPLPSTSPPPARDAGIDARPPSRP